MTAAVGRPRVRSLVIGLRSVDWPSLHPHLDAGRMPNLLNLIERGASATLASARPLTREVLWTSLATGLLGDRHGVLWQIEIRPDNGGVQRTGRRSWRAPAFWELLEAEGIATACVNWPATSPADRWPGVHVDEAFAMPSGDSFENWALPEHCLSPTALRQALSELRVHPTDPLHEELAALVPRFQEAVRAKNEQLTILATMLASTATVHAAATHIAALPDWDVLCVVYDLLHIAKSAFRKEDGAGVFGGVVVQAHAFLDLMLGRLFELAGPDTAVTIVSPNGLSWTSRGEPRGHPRGILIATGPGIAADAMLPGAEAVDLAPTLLARYGLATATDGRVLTSLVPSAPIRPAVLPTAAPPDPATSDPAEELLAEGYTDPLKKEQVEAMRDAESLRLQHLGIARQSRGNHAAAAEAFEAALQLYPDSPRALRRLAQCRALLGDFSACLPVGEALLTLEPASPWGHLLLGTCHAFMDHPDLVEPYLASAHELGAGIPAVLAQLGGIAMLRGRLGDAVTLFGEALILEPDRPDALFGLGAALEQQGDAVGAEQALRRAVQAQYHLPLAHQRLGMLLASQSRWQEAVTALEIARAQQPDLPNIEAQLHRARSLLTQRMVRQAAIENGVH